MKTRTKIQIVAALLALAAVGCQGPQTTPPSVVARDHTISVEELARQLGLRLDDRDDTFVVLRDADNTVLIFTHSNGRFFVNGKPIGPVGTVRREAGTVYVSEMLAAQIRPHLDAAQPAVQPTPRLPRRGGHVVIDPGHGGRDPGAIGVRGTYEKDVNLAVALMVAAELQRRGVTVTMTRQDDRYVENENRADLANRLRADLFVSIHADSAPNASAQGFTLYIAPTASSDTVRAARSISNSMATTGAQNRGVNRANYLVLVQTRGPAILIELGYLSNAQEEAMLRSSAYQNRLATAIAAGIADYLR